MKKNILLLLTLGTIQTALLAEDTGWYLTRKSPYQANAELEKRVTNIRDLITDCTERSISLSCHRAGVWFIAHKNEAKGIKYLDNACTLGRGYSCRTIGLIYFEQLKNTNAEVDKKEMQRLIALRKKTKNYFATGCYRRDTKSCDYILNLPPLPRAKITFLEKINNLFK